MKEIKDLVLEGSFIGKDTRKLSPLKVQVIEL